MILLFLILSLFFFIRFFDSKNEKAEYSKLSGLLESYKIETFSELGRSNLKNYTLKISGERCPLKISSGILWLFNEKQFKQDIKLGDSLTIYFDSNEIQCDGSTEIIGIESKKTYLNYRRVLNEKAIPIDLIAATLFLSATILFIFFHFYSKDDSKNA